MTNIISVALYLNLGGLIFYDISLDDTNEDCEYNFLNCFLTTYYFMDS